MGVTTTTHWVLAPGCDHETQTFDTLVLSEHQVSYWHFNVRIAPKFLKLRFHCNTSFFTVQTYLQPSLLGYLNSTIFIAFFICSIILSQVLSVKRMMVMKPKSKARELWYMTSSMEKWVSVQLRKNKWELNKLIHQYRWKPGPYFSNIGKQRRKLIGPHWLERYFHHERK